MNDNAHPELKSYFFMKISQNQFLILDYENFEQEQ